MKYAYTLRIHTPLENFEKLNKLLGVRSNTDYGWGYEVIENQEDEAFNFITEFLKILEDKEQELVELGVKSEEVEFWMIYEYEGQCNMEFKPEQLKRLGEKGYTLCISCYEEKSEFYIPPSPEKYN